MVVAKMKELLIELRPSEMLYIQAMKDFLDSKTTIIEKSENRRLVLTALSLARKSLENATYLGQARLALLFLNLELGSTRKKYFKVFLRSEEYSQFWYMGELLGLEKKKDILIGTLMLAEKERRVQQVVWKLLLRLADKIKNDDELHQAVSSSLAKSKE